MNGKFQSGLLVNIQKFKQLIQKLTYNKDYKMADLFAYILILKTGGNNQQNKSKADLDMSQRQQSLQDTFQIERQLQRLHMDDNKQNNIIRLSPIYTQQNQIKYSSHSSNFSANRSKLTQNDHLLSNLSHTLQCSTLGKYQRRERYYNKFIENYNANKLKFKNKYKDYCSNQTQNEFQQQRSSVGNDGDDYMKDITGNIDDAITLGICSEIKDHIERETQIVFRIMTTIRKSLCQSDIINSLNFIMDSRIYANIIRYSEKLLTSILCSTISQNESNRCAEMLKECLWILTNLSTGTKDQVAKMVQAGILDVAHRGLMATQYKCIVAISLELIGNIVGQQNLKNKLFFLQNRNFKKFYLNMLPQYWYQDHGRFNETILWTLLNTFRKVPSLIQDQQRWQQLLIGYIPIIQLLFSMSYETTTQGYNKTRETQINSKNDHILSQPFLQSLKKPVTFLSNCREFPKNSEFRIVNQHRLIKKCYMLLSITTSISFPFFYEQMNQVLKKYKIKNIPESSHIYLIKIYWNIVGNLGPAGIKLMNQYSGVVNFLIDCIGRTNLLKRTSQLALHNSLSQKHNLLYFSDQCCPILCSIQIITYIFTKEQATDYFINKNLKYFVNELVGWFQKYQTNSYITLQIIKMYINLVNIANQLNLTKLVGKLFKAQPEILECVGLTVVNFGQRITIDIQAQLSIEQTIQKCQQFTVLLKRYQEIQDKFVSRIIKQSRCLDSFKYIQIILKQCKNWMPIRVKNISQINKQLEDQLSKIYESLKSKVKVYEREQSELNKKYICYQQVNSVIRQNNKKNIQKLFKAIPNIFEGFSKNAPVFQQFLMVNQMDNLSMIDIQSQDQTSRKYISKPSKKVH